MSDEETSGVTVPPPFVYFVSMLLGIGLGQLCPFSLLAHPIHGPVVCSGPFRYSRNPIHLSLTTLTIGVAFVVDSTRAGSDAGSEEQAP